MKKMILFVLLIMLVVPAGCIKIPVGDGGTLELGKDGISIGSGDEKLDIRVNDGEMVIAGVDGEGQSFQQTVSSGQQLPDAFPKDFPIVSDVELTVIDSDIDGKKQYIVHFTTEGTVKQFYDQYKNYMDQAGYTDMIDVSGGKAADDSKMETISGKKDDHSLMVSIMAESVAADERNVVVNFMFMEN